MTGNILQSTYSRYMPVAQAGTPATMTGWDADSKIMESATCPFGYVVSKGSADRGVILGGNLFAGITVRDVTIQHSTADRFEIYDNVAVLTRGDIWVRSEDSVEAKQRVEYNVSTGQCGSDGGTVIVGAVWMTTTAAGELGIVRLGNTAGDVTT